MRRSSTTAVLLLVVIVGLGTPCPTGSGSHTIRVEIMDTNARQFSGGDVYVELFDDQGQSVRWQAFQAPEDSRSPRRLGRKIVSFRNVPPGMYNVVTLAVIPIEEEEDISFGTIVPGDKTSDPEQIAASQGYGIGSKHTDKWGQYEVMSILDVTKRFLWLDSIEPDQLDEGRFIATGIKIKKRYYFYMVMPVRTMVFEGEAVDHALVVLPGETPESAATLAFRRSGKVLAATLLESQALPRILEENRALAYLLQSDPRQTVVSGLAVCALGDLENLISLDTAWNVGTSVFFKLAFTSPGGR